MLLELFVIFPVPLVAVLGLVHPWDLCQIQEKPHWRQNALLRNVGKGHEELTRK